MKMQHSRPVSQYRGLQYTESRQGARSISPEVICDYQQIKWPNTRSAMSAIRKRNGSEIKVSSSSGSSGSSSSTNYQICTYDFREKESLFLFCIAFDRYVALRVMQCSTTRSRSTRLRTTSHDRASETKRNECYFLSVTAKPIFVRVGFEHSLIAKSIPITNVSMLCVNMCLRCFGVCCNVVTALRKDASMIRFYMNGVSERVSLHCLCIRKVYDAEGDSDSQRQKQFHLQH